LDVSYRGEPKAQVTAVHDCVKYVYSSIDQCRLIGLVTVEGLITMTLTDVINTFFVLSTHFAVQSYCHILIFGWEIPLEEIFMKIAPLH
jgi:hypothetical protein